MLRPELDNSSRSADPTDPHPATHPATATAPTADGGELSARQRANVHHAHVERGGWEVERQHETAGGTGPCEAERAAPGRPVGRAAASGVATVRGDTLEATPNSDDQSADGPAPYAWLAHGRSPPSTGSSQDNRSPQRSPQRSPRCSPWTSGGRDGDGRWDTRQEAQGSTRDLLAEMTDLSNVCADGEVASEGSSVPTIDADYFWTDPELDADDVPSRLRPRPRRCRSTPGSMAVCGTRSFGACCAGTGRARSAAGAQQAAWCASSVQKHRRRAAADFVS